MKHSSHQKQLNSNSNKTGVNVGIPEEQQNHSEQQLTVRVCRKSGGELETTGSCFCPNSIAFLLMKAL